MPKYEATIERIELTPGKFRRQPFDYSWNEAGIDLVALRTEWPFSVEIEEEGIQGIALVLAKIFREFGSMAYEVNIWLLEKDRESSEESEEEQIPF